MMSASGNFMFYTLLMMRAATSASSHAFSLSTRHLPKILLSFRYAEKIVANQKFTSTEPLDLMKFICKEFWEEVFKKKVSQRRDDSFEVVLIHLITALVSEVSSSFLFPCVTQIDKLQTNHKGIYVLSDFKFKWLDRYASDDIATKQAASNMLHFPCGILRGALANLGMSSIVNADFNSLPGCTFNIRMRL